MYILLPNVNNGPLIFYSFASRRFLMPAYYLFFPLRSLLEFDDIDRCCLEAWSETLENFGYTVLTRELYQRDLRDRTGSEVMKALCPYTTQMEWGPVVNKRDVRLRRELDALVEVEALPRDGARNFLRECRATGETFIVVTSNFGEDIVKGLLDKAGLASLVHAVVPYHELEFGIIDALEILKVPPPRLPPNIRTEFDILPTLVSAGIFVCFPCDKQTTVEAKSLGFGLVIGIDTSDAGEHTRELLEAGAKSTVADFKRMSFEYVKMMLE